MKVYVGTYGKYNSGSLSGKWMELDNYADKESFYEACEELHKDEYDAELMFQDYEDIPAGMISESWISEEVWELLEMDEDDKNAIQAYRDDIDESAETKDILDRLITTAESFRDYADDYADENMACSDAPEILKNYFDYESFARDLAYDCSIAYFEGKCYIFSA